LQIFLIRQMDQIILEESNPVLDGKQQQGSENEINQLQETLDRERMQWQQQQKQMKIEAEHEKKRLENEILKLQQELENENKKWQEKLEREKMKWQEATQQLKNDADRDNRENLQLDLRRSKTEEILESKVKDLQQRLEQKEREKMLHYNHSEKHKTSLEPMEPTKKIEEIKRFRKENKKQLDAGFHFGIMNFTSVTLNVDVFDYPSAQWISQKGRKIGVNVGAQVTGGQIGSNFEGSKTMEVKNVTGYVQQQAVAQNERILISHYDNQAYVSVNYRNSENRLQYIVRKAPLGITGQKISYKNAKVFLFSEEDLAKDLPIIESEDILAPVVVVPLAKNKEKG